MKERLDVLLVNKGFADSREKAKRIIMAGLVKVDGKTEDKPGSNFDENSNIEIEEGDCPYVSRGGLKLQKGIEEWDICLNNAICVDMGASTGGFTDCMLKHGASKVYAIDVGYGQLDYKLRNDERVINIERTNIRYLDISIIKDTIDFISIDVSFISLRHMLPIAAQIISGEGLIFCLIKPQFEAGKHQVGKGGIVRDAKIHEDVIYKVLDYANKSSLYPMYLSYSPIKGSKGNIEYILLLSSKKCDNNITVKQTVIESHDIK